MILAGEIGLIDGTVFLSPFVEFEKAVLIWHIWYTTENRVTWRCQPLYDNETWASGPYLWDLAISVFLPAVGSSSYYRQSV
jgi:hypothetical protein